MKCQNCPLKDAGQTGRTFNVKYKEHIHAIIILVIPDIQIIY
jgi:hypothetical protein